MSLGEANAMSSAPARKRNPRADALLDVALDLFSSKGYGEVSMQEIAQRAGVTYSLLYYYYKNKEDLFHAAVSHAVEQAIGNYETVRSQQRSPVDRIDDWFDNNIQLAESLKKLVKTMLDFSAKRDGSPSVAKDIEQFYRFERQILSDSIRAGVEQGLFTCASPDDTAAFISTHIDGIFYGDFIHPELDIETAMLRLKQVLWRLLDCQALIAERARNWPSAVN